MLAIFVFVLALALRNASSSRGPRISSTAASQSGDSQGVLHEQHARTESDAPGPPTFSPSPPTFHALRENDLEGNEVAMSQFKGSVLYITNVATY